MLVPRFSCTSQSLFLNIKSEFNKTGHLATIRRRYTNRNVLSLKERGLVSAIFPDNAAQLTNLCTGKPQTFYAGFDPTADSLHVGNLAVLNMLVHCQRAGHRVIALIGGATGMIGDPTGRNTERPEMDTSIVQDNCHKISENIKRVFDNHEKYIWSSKNGTEKLPQIKIVNNIDWYSSLSAIELIGHYGRHFRVKPMLTRSSIQSRLDVPKAALSYTEFSYQVFQGFDWFHLHKTYDCNFQIGGHDQMGNIMSGHDLISRVLKKQVYGLTVPLIKSKMGNKYGKTARNAVWLDPEKTSPFDLYQFLIRSADDEVEKFLYTFTFRTKDEIDAIMRKHTANPDAQKAQTKLAKDVTLLVHGEEGLKSAVRATDALYSENIEALASLTPEEMTKIFLSSSVQKSVDSVNLMLEAGTTILDMAIQAGCFTNRVDAVRIIEAGGFYLNHQRVRNFEEIIVPGIHILPNKTTLARVGKKNYYVINWRL